MFQQQDFSISIEIERGIYGVVFEFQDLIEEIHVWIEWSNVWIEKWHVWIDEMHAWTEW